MKVVLILMCVGRLDVLLAVKKWGVKNLENAMHDTVLLLQNVAKKSSRPWHLRAPVTPNSLKYGPKKFSYQNLKKGRLLLWITQLFISQSAQKTSSKGRGASFFFCHPIVLTWTLLNSSGHGSKDKFERALAHFPLLRRPSITSLIHAIHNLI